MCRLRLPRNADRAIVLRRSKRRGIIAGSVLWRIEGEAHFTKGEHERRSRALRIRQSECNTTSQLLHPKRARGQTAIVAATGATTDSEIDQRRTELLDGFTEVRDKAFEEMPQPYLHYASRFNVVGVYQGHSSEPRHAPARDRSDAVGSGRVS